MFHLCAYEEDIGTTADTELDAIPDDVVNRESDRFKFLQDMDIVFAMAMSATLNRAKLSCPSYRNITSPYITPVEVGATPGDYFRLMDLRNSPLRLPRREQLTVEATSDIAMGTEQAFVLLGVRDRFMPSPSGNSFLLRGTSTTAATADRWTEVDVTWEDIPKQGTYTVVGLHYIAATGVAARVNFQNQIWRPGCVAVDTVGDQPHPMFMHGGLGSWGKFDADTFPLIEVLNAAAVAVHTFYLEIVPDRAF